LNPRLPGYEPWAKERAEACPLRTDQLRSSEFGSERLSKGPKRDTNVEAVRARTATSR